MRDSNCAWQNSKRMLGPQGGNTLIAVMTKTERKLFLAFLGILATDPIVWLAQSGFDKFAGGLIPLVESNQFFVNHRNDFYGLCVLYGAVVAVLLPTGLLMLLVAEVVLGKGSRTEGALIIRRNSFAIGGRGSDFFAWLLGFVAGLWMTVLTSKEMGFSEKSAWNWLVGSAAAVMVLRLVQSRTWRRRFWAKWRSFVGVRSGK